MVDGCVINVDKDLALKAKTAIDELLLTVTVKDQKYISLKAASNALVKVLCDHSQWKNTHGYSWRCKVCDEHQWRIP